jgi:DNA-binding HxlR family transcriptional regulator/putative sterol carrier protein
MGIKRSYGDACGIARALDVVGERWALMVVRELLLGPKRFTDIRAGLPHVSPDMLAQRLRDLEQAGLVHHRRLPPPYGSQVYELTASGRALESTLLELGRWGGAFAPPPHDDMGMSVDAHILSLRALFDAERAGDFSARVELRLDSERFCVVIADGTVEAGRGELPDADIVIEADPPMMLLEVLHGHRRLAEALAAETIHISGDKRKAKRFMTLFPLPAPAAAVS